MLIGKSLTLRPITLADQKMLLDWFNDPDFIGPYDNHWTASLERLEKIHHESAHQGQHDYLIIDRASGEPLGEIGYGNRFSFPDYQAEELGYIVHPAQRGRRVATQAVCILINHLFDATPINRIQAGIVVGNDASCRVAEHAGMTQEGILRGLIFLHGRYVDMQLYSILRSEWRDEATYRQARGEF